MGKARRMYSTTHCFTKLDEDDRMARKKERKRRRKERWNKRFRKPFDHRNPYDLPNDEDNLYPQVVHNDDMEFLSDERDEDFYGDGRYPIDGCLTFDIEFRSSVERYRADNNR